MSTRRQVLPQLGVVGGEADGIALMQHQVGQRRGNILRILKLAEVLPLVPHAAGGVEEEMGPEVGLLLILLDEVPIGLAVGAPIDVADLVTGIVLAVLGELDAEALIGALVNAGEEALNEIAGHQ